MAVIATIIFLILLISYLVYRKAFYNPPKENTDNITPYPSIK